MTASKAIAGGAAGPLVLVITALLELIPGWTEVPDEIKTSIQALLATLVSAGLVYLAPANRAKPAA